MGAFVLSITHLRTIISGLSPDKKDFRNNKMDRLEVITSTKDAKTIIPKIKDVFALYKPKVLDDRNVTVGKFNIIIKQQRQQRNLPINHVRNEFNFGDYINQAIDDNGFDPLDILCVSENGGSPYKLSNIVLAQSVGLLTPRIGNKADIILIDNKNKRFPISLKQDNASRWGSPDLELKPLGEKFFKYVLDKKLTSVLKTEKQDVYSLGTPIGFKLPEKFANFMVFGKDIHPNGAILIKTWAGSDFKLTHKQTSLLTINCSYIYRKFSDLSEKHIPYFVLRNDSSRKVASNIIPPGIRYEVVYEGGGKRGVKIIDYSPS